VSVLTSDSSCDASSVVKNANATEAAVSGADTTSSSDLLEPVAAIEARDSVVGFRGAIPDARLIGPVGNEEPGAASDNLPGDFGTAAFVEGDNGSSCATSRRLSVAANDATASGGSPSIIAVRKSDVDVKVKVVKFGGRDGNALCGVCLLSPLIDFSVFVVFIELYRNARESAEYHNLIRFIELSYYIQGLFYFDDDFLFLWSKALHFTDD